MRSAIIGVTFAHDKHRMYEFVHASTCITHTDPKAFYGALAVALAAAQGREEQPNGFGLNRLLEDIPQLIGDQDDVEEFLDLLERVSISVKRGQSVEVFADSLGLGKGISGYVYHTVPVALHSAYSTPNDFSCAVQAVIRCGGDTDTVAAIVGGIVGAWLGVDGVPRSYLSKLAEWPRSVHWMKRLGYELADCQTSPEPSTPPGLPIPALLLRNLLFLLLVLAHGFRRLAPPY